MSIYKLKAQAYRDEKRHEQGQQRKQREEMAMKLVDSDVIMVPYEQCDYDNFSYVNISSYSDSVPQQSQRRHDCFERNTPNNSDTNHCADNAEHWKRPFDSNEEYNIRHCKHGYRSQGYNHGYDAWYHYQRKPYNTNQNGRYHHYLENRSSLGFSKQQTCNYGTNPCNYMSNCVSNCQTDTMKNF